MLQGRVGPPNSCRMRGRSEPRLLKRRRAVIDTHHVIRLDWMGEIYHNGNVFSIMSRWYSVTLSSK